MTIDLGFAYLNQNITIIKNSHKFYAHLFYRSIDLTEILKRDLNVIIVLVTHYFYEEQFFLLSIPFHLALP